MLPLARARALSCALTLANTSHCGDMPRSVHTGFHILMLKIALPKACSVPVAAAELRAASPSVVEGLGVLSWQFWVV